MAILDGSDAADVLAAVALAAEDGADLIDLVDLAPERTVGVVRAVRTRFPSLPVGVAARSRAGAAAAVEAGADLLTGPDTGAAASTAGVVCTGVAEAEQRYASGLSRASILIDVSLSSEPLRQAEELAAAGWAVLATCEKLVDEGPDAILAATAIAANRGVRVFRTRHVKLIRRTVDMAASIAGTRPPVRALRALA